MLRSVNHLVHGLGAFLRPYARSATWRPPSGAAVVIGSRLAGGEFGQFQPRDRRRNSVTAMGATAGPLCGRHDPTSLRLAAAARLPGPAAWIPAAPARSISYRGRISQAAPSRLAPTRGRSTLPAASLGRVAEPRRRRRASRLRDPDAH